MKLGFIALRKLPTPVKINSRIAHLVKLGFIVLRKLPSSLDISEITTAWHRIHLLKELPACSYFVFLTSTMVLFIHGYSPCQNLPHMSGVFVVVVSPCTYILSPVSWFKTLLTAD